VVAATGAVAGRAHRRGRRAVGGGGWREAGRSRGPLSRAARRRRAGRRLGVASGACGRARGRLSPRRARPAGAARRRAGPGGRAHRGGSHLSGRSGATQPAGPPTPQAGGRPARRIGGAPDAARRGDGGRRGGVHDPVGHASLRLAGLGAAVDQQPAALDAACGGAPRADRRRSRGRRRALGRSPAGGPARNGGGGRGGAAAGRLRRLERPRPGGGEEEGRKRSPGLEGVVPDGRVGTDPCPSLLVPRYRPLR